MNALKRCWPAVGLCLALACASCGQSKGLKRYRGTTFDLDKPSTGGWVLVANPKRFALAAPQPKPGVPDVSKAKVAELVHREQRASIEVYLVDGGAQAADQVMDALLRKSRRRGITEGERKARTVGGKQGLVSIVVWQQTRQSPKQYLYCARVPLGDALWCFVGSVEEAQFESVRKDFRAVLDSVKFHR